MMQLTWPPRTSPGEMPRFELLGPAATREWLRFREGKCGSDKSNQNKEG